MDQTKTSLLEETLQTAEGKQWFGHPRGLFYLFFAELWERFSFYGMKAMLVVYMTDHLLYSDAMSFGIFAAYGSLVYATPPLGGMIADKILGYRKAIFLGGILMAIGHLTLSVEHPIFFYGSLALIVIGNGFFKPNISSMVGAIYKKQPGKIDSGFTIFYLGINLGGMIAPLLCAWLGMTYGWHYGFGLAGVGMVFGLLFFQGGTKSNVFGEEGNEPKSAQTGNGKKIMGLNGKVVIGSVLAVPLVAGLIFFHEYEHYLMIAVTAVLALVIAKIFRESSSTERSRLMAALYFTFLATVFWAVFEQAGSSITLFAKRNVELLGINAAQTNSINSTFIIMLCLPFAFLWTFLSKIKRNPATPIKFAVGLVAVGIGFVIFASSAREVNELARTPMFFLLFGYFIYTVGEMFISPVGLAKITELSPAKYVSFIMGVWFIAASFGHFFAGIIARLTASGSEAPAWMNSSFMKSYTQTVTGLDGEQVAGMGEGFQQLYTYVSTYAAVGLITIALGLLALAATPVVKKWMKGVH
ncbi:putative transporter YclF (plasmid) [Fulvitalea axinellae]|uniref:Transporter YclF n=1 Tax=Fulvitalea axinellae TaxID=1182444 RepID=A0AAU9CKY6_9BACT|nr:putative transporter YclF [Fulvitalea axinellae]